MMAKSLLLIAAAAAATVANAELSCTAYGGYLTEPTPCVGSCRDYVKDAPYIGAKTNPNTTVSDTSQWCTTVNDYPGKKQKNRKAWGFCECVFTPKEVFYADGAGVEGGVLKECATSGIIKYNGGSVAYNGGCIPFEVKYPYTAFALALPTQDGTNQSAWCPTVKEYKAKDGAGKARKNWGYCFATTTTRAPTQNPTPKPTTSPTVSKPTTSPTVFIPESIFTATGGGVSVNNPGSDSLPCIIPFKVRTKKRDIEYNSCVSFTEQQPYTEADLTWNGPTKEIDGVFVNTTGWCAITNEIYNPTASKTPSNRYNWGYCTESNTTRSPTPGSGTPQPETPAPTSAPGTITFPTPEPTSAPGTITFPTPEPTSAPGTFTPVTSVPSFAPSFTPTSAPSSASTRIPTIVVAVCTLIAYIAV